MDQLSVAIDRSGSTRPVDKAAAVQSAPLVLRLPSGREVGLEQALSIGSAADNDLVLDDACVSAHHCVIQPLAGRALVVDAGSLNGTFLGGLRVTTADLLPGMRLTLGRTALEIAPSWRAVPTWCGLLGRNHKMRQLLDKIRHIAPTRAPVLLGGESGTGKELAARALHEQSGRTGPFVALNCSAISPELMESELFGHERGAFTGAAGRRAGVFEEADRGTLLLDEIGELPLGAQPKLLRALESGLIRAVGASGERRVDVRLVAATHRDLREAVARRAFRLDLYHRLCMVELRLPTLRERYDDLPLLAHHFLDEVAGELGHKVLSPAAMEAMQSYGWPGNVRELRNAIHRAAILGGEVLLPDDVLPAESRGEVPDESRIPIDGRRFEDIEREVILVALRRSRGNRRAAAAALGLPKSTLCDKVHRFGIDIERLKRDLPLEDD